MIKIKRIDNRGNISIIMCIIMTGLLGISAYVIDIGAVYAERIKLSNAVDAAALAGGQELPEHPDWARDIAYEYLGKNNVDTGEVVVKVSEDNKSIMVQANKDVNHVFAVIFGKDRSKVNVSSKAIIGPIKSVTGGIRPLGVEAFDYSFGDLVTLKEGGGDGYHGNYGAVALGGFGANLFEENALYGYDGTLTVGDRIDTEPGNMAGAVNAIKNYISGENSSYDHFERDSIRVWTLPLVDSMAVDGRSEVTVVGFAQFFIEDIEKKSGKMEIKGRFIRFVTNGEIDLNAEDTGSYGIKLVE